MIKQKRDIKNAQNKKGFTLIEILVVIGIIAVLAAVVLVAINPSRQFKLARDSQRTSNVTAILNAVGQNIAEHRGVFFCNGMSMDIPSADTVRITNDANNQDKIDLAPCLVPDYISSLPFDPSKPDAFYNDPQAYDTGYSLIKDADGRITISADGEITPTLSVTR